MHQVYWIYMLLMCCGKCNSLCQAEDDMLRESLMKLSLLGGSGAKERGRDRERERVMEGEQS